MIGQADIEHAHKRLLGRVINTPLVFSNFLSEYVEGEVWLKCENFQKVHAFKARGAFNALLKLDNKSDKIVATHSSGNHGQALAYAAQQLGFKAYIVMPDNAPKVKVEGVKKWNAEVVFCKPGLANREAALNQVVKETQAVFIPPFNHTNVIEGQATCAYEIFKAQTDFDYLLAPVGGGGLLSGSALAAHYFSLKTKVIGVEPQEADDAYQSFNTGKLIPLKHTNTIADGLRTSLGDITFNYIKQYVHQIELVSENEIKAAWKHAFEYEKLLIEPSCAVPLAYVLKNKAHFAYKKTAIILTGGNVDIDFFMETLYPQ